MVKSSSNKSGRVSALEYKKRTPIAATAPKKKKPTMSAHDDDDDDDDYVESDVSSSSEADVTTRDTRENTVEGDAPRAKRRPRKIGRQRRRRGGLVLLPPSPSPSPLPPPVPHQTGMSKIMDQIAEKDADIHNVNTAINMGRTRRVVVLPDVLNNTKNAIPCTQMRGEGEENVGFLTGKKISTAIWSSSDNMTALHRAPLVIRKNFRVKAMKQIVPFETYSHAVDFQLLVSDILFSSTILQCIEPPADGAEYYVSYDHGQLGYYVDGQSFQILINYAVLTPEFRHIPPSTRNRTLGIKWFEEYMPVIKGTCTPTKQHMKKHDLWDKKSFARLVDRMEKGGFIDALEVLYTEFKESLDIAPPIHRDDVLLKKTDKLTIWHFVSFITKASKYYQEEQVIFAILGILWRDMTVNPKIISPWTQVSESSEPSTSIPRLGGRSDASSRDKQAWGILGGILEMLLFKMTDTIHITDFQFDTYMLTSQANIFFNQMLMAFFELPKQYGTADIAYKELPKPKLHTEEFCPLTFSTY
jgi:hypothetical protein